MKIGLLLFPFVLLGVSGCGTINRMNSLVNESTNSIYSNVDAVQSSTAAIRTNARLVDESTRTIVENKRLLEAASH